MNTISINRKNLMSSMIVGFMLMYSVGLTVFYFQYRRPDYRDLVFLTQCKTEQSVRNHFGREPEIIYTKGDRMQQLGWKLPDRDIVDKVLIYTNRSSLRFYVYIDANGRVEYVFSSFS